MPFAFLSSITSNFYSSCYGDLESIHKILGVPGGGKVRRKECNCISLAFMRKFTLDI